MELRGVREVKGTLEVLSGLHIGSGEASLGIGVADATIARLPNGEPYIPGSSLKGKVRGLLELASGLMTVTAGRPLSARILEMEHLSDVERTRALLLLKLFGVADAKGDPSQSVGSIGPARAIFRDARLVRDDGQTLSDLVEVKGENRINRIRGGAEGARTVERIRPGVKFSFVILLRYFDGDDALPFLATLLKGLRLLEYDALGASGTRGYGQVAFALSDAVASEWEATSIEGGVFA